MRLLSLVLCFGLAALAGCASEGAGPIAGMQGARVAGEDATIERLTSQQQTAETSLLFYSTEDRRVAFKRIGDILPTRVIRAGESRYPLGQNPVDFSSVTYDLGDTSYTVDDFLALPPQIGLLVVKDGNVLLEHYANGNDRSSRWISFSVSKSVTSMLIGAAIQDGYIQSVDEPVTNYLPRLRGTGYEGTTIRHVLQMSSGVAWNEDYADPNSDVARAGGANGLPLVTYLGGLERVNEPGKVFNYNTGETNLVGEILRAAIGNNASTYLEHKIWKPFGMEANANWLLGGAGGGETGGCCISATLRDYARIGLFAMNDGVLADGTRVLPKGWMQASTTPSAGAPYYGYLWWLLPDGSYAARGIFGQQIFIDPASDLVIAVHSNAQSAVGSDYHDHLRALVPALRKHVAGTVQ